jgi:hypothetical protein
MEIKLSPLEVPPDNPFKFDVLKREESVEVICNLLDTLNCPFVLAIDSPWGTGKTTFVKMLKAILESKDYVCLYFNAWETDFTNDPLVAFLGEFEDIKGKIKKNRKPFEINYNRAKKIATILAKRALPVAGRIATAGLLNLDELTEKALAEFAEENIKNAVDAYSKEKDLIKQFHESLAESLKSLEKNEKKDQLIFFIDEIDRCRPTYAIEVLERMKHLFNIENVIFVLSLDKSQLSVSLKAIYGEGLNTDEYLRRFIDLEYFLPKAPIEAFTHSLIERFGFEAFFKERSNPNFRYDHDNIVDVFSALSEILELSLRAREQCFTLISVAMRISSSKSYLYPIILTTLIILKISSPNIYKNYVLQGGTASEVVNYFRSKNGGPEFLNSHIGRVTEAFLIISQKNKDIEKSEIVKYRNMSKDQSIEQNDKERAEIVIQIIESIFSRFDGRPDLEDVVRKIELASNFH